MHSILRARSCAFLLVWGVTSLGCASTPQTAPDEAVDAPRAEPATGQHPFAPRGDMALPRLTPKVVVVTGQLALPSQWPTAEKIERELALRPPAELTEVAYLNRHRETPLPEGEVVEEAAYGEHEGVRAQDVSLMQGVFAQVEASLVAEYGELDFAERVASFSCMIVPEDAGTDVLTCLSAPTGEGDGPMGRWLVFDFYHGSLPPEEPGEEPVAVASPSGETHVYQDIEVRAPRGVDVRVDASGMYAGAGLHGPDECAPLAFEVTYVPTHLDLEGPAQIAVDEPECRGVMHRALIDVSKAGVQLRARALCVARGEVAASGAPTPCDDLMGSVRKVSERERVDVGGVPAVSEPILRERLLAERFNDHGKHELFVPGESRWMMVDALGELKLGAEGVPAYLFATDAVPAGKNVHLLARSPKGSWMTHELDYAIAGAYSGEGDEETFRLFLMMDEGPCHVYGLGASGSPEVARGASCPRDASKAGEVFLGTAEILTSPPARRP